jgi:hypothetical protein
MVDLGRLTGCQNDAAQGLYTTAMSGFVQWFAKRHDWYRREIRQNRFSRFRQKATASGQHHRTPTIVAELFIGLYLFRAFAHERAVWTTDDGRDWLMRGWEALEQAAAAQRTHQASSNPAQRFVELLAAALASGKAYVTTAIGNQPPNAQAWGLRWWGDDWKRRGDRIGCLDKASLYLEPEASYAVVQALAQQGGEPLAVGSKTLSKELRDQKMLLSTDTKRDRVVIRKTLEGTKRAVLHLRAKLLG